MDWRPVLDQLVRVLADAGEALAAAIEQQVHVVAVDLELGDTDQLPERGNIDFFGRHRGSESRGSAG